MLTKAKRILDFTESPWPGGTDAPQFQRKRQRKSRLVRQKGADYRMTCIRDRYSRRYGRDGNAGTAHIDEQRNRLGARFREVDLSLIRLKASFDHSQPVGSAIQSQPSASVAIRLRHEDSAGRAIRRRDRRARNCRPARVSDRDSKLRHRPQLGADARNASQDADQRRPSARPHSIKTLKPRRTPRRVQKTAKPAEVRLSPANRSAKILSSPRNSQFRRNPILFKEKKIR